ncbi:hypothetical protein [Acidiplasma cupricumulans]|uniref:hypothetical protein n=1 Tax=Acidiplasma cupricumulans TaxID=312540 RepID=UPI0015849C08|nr:hypothetical protein [Acidiplasma cupricumulans]
MNEMNNNGIEVKKACYYSGINRITYYYRRKHENNEDRRYITRIDNNFYKNQNFAIIRILIF